MVFQSTPSARRATGDGFAFDGVLLTFQSTPSARRATLNRHHAEVWRLISIHALREEGDEDEPLLGLVHLISIHALREEGDAGAAACRCG